MVDSLRKKDYTTVVHGQQKKMEKMSTLIVEFSETVKLETRIWQENGEMSRLFPGGSWLLTNVKSQIRSIDGNKKRCAVQ